MKSQISKFDYFVYGISLALCFLLFKQSDLTHTNASSFAYLHGHIWDFYDYNKIRTGGNDYLPIFYLIFALWNFPLKLLGLVPEISIETWMYPTIIQTIWSKLLLAIFFFASVNLIGKISNQCCISIAKKQCNQNENFPKILFASSPIAIFAVFIFGGYDIFSIFFMLLGLRAYFAKDFKCFVVWFSIAISFKYFAAFAYLPLVLIIEKRFIHMLIYGLSGLMVTIIQFAFYWHSDIFLGEIFRLATTKTAGGGINVRLVIFNCFYFGMCAYLYFSKFNYREDLVKWYCRAILGCMLSYAFLFSWVIWHPQWIILFTPFACLFFLFIHSKKLLITLIVVEIFGYFGFAIFTMKTWAANVDNTMVYQGVFGGLLPQTSILASEIIGRPWKVGALLLFYFFLYAPFLFFIFQYLSTKNPTHKNFQKRYSDLFSFTSDEKRLLSIRLLVGCYFYIVVTVLCFW